MPSPRSNAASILLALLLIQLPQAFGQTIDFPETLPGTKALTIEEPLDEVMVDGINRFALRELDASVERRNEKWHRDYRNPAAYARSVSQNRERLGTIIGAVDLRVKSPVFELLTTLRHDGLAGVSKEGGFRIHYVRWRVLGGVTAEGLLLQPGGTPRARVVVLPDADWTPEMFTGLAEPDNDATNVPSHSPLVLAANGCQVVVPTLISRDDEHSGHPQVAYTNQPHREFVYRMAFEMGRHVIGYEVQKVLAAVDAFEQLNEIEKTDLPIGACGVGEGGLLALYSAALDPRIDATMVGGYFQKREGIWEEPIYRNVWSLLTEFGDAELASLVAPRTLVIEACSVPEVAGPPKPRPGRRGGAAPGRIETATLASVRGEFERVKEHYGELKQSEKLTLAISGDGTGPAGTEAALSAFVKGLGIAPEARTEPQPKVEDSLRESPTLKPPAVERVELPEGAGDLYDPARRQYRQFAELVAFTQDLLRESAKVRDAFWAKADRSSIEAWTKSTRYYRKHVWEEMIGRLPVPTIPPNVRTRRIIDEPQYKGYEVVIDVYPDVIAAGILLLPTDIKPGEKRPVVVCQHGLEGTPMDTITRDGRAYGYYKAFSAELAKRGFITYAPQNPYRGGDRFRTIQRKSNPMKRSLFSYIVPQHQRTLDWLQSLPYVEAGRIGFYGLSYGGKTAVRVPPLLDDYALSICSADFNEWVKKNVSNEDRYSYIFTGEYEIFEWNMGHTANYAELSSLMAPRPFMVERGHDDGVAPDEWVAWEYAKVRRHYAKLGIPEKTEIEFFNGPHSINGKGTFEFLHRHLRWPEPGP